ncbi:unnamed protein product [Kuraishia capsulata CBS 1993]|uniref:Nodulin-like domain-containing protein n=1 Tax=Kuraishia capsulata CBS 1993 TaxID=1382522 RepID=W6MLW4_9ASCO|nr:uncharacterized protein KUCA_T00003477001 [Kuraishia capsulata CBS 1993]CDK27499.1 unnamed protein product [Kuraishia capsulata CBS 1993]
MFFFQVSKQKRLAQVICAIVWCLFSGGPIFGFAALKPVLVGQHVYENYCDPSVNPPEISTPMLYLTQIFGSEVSKNDASVALCTAQDLKLNMMFTIGAVLTNISALTIGRTLDFYGPRVCGLIGSFFLFFACFVFINAKEISLFDPYLVGYASMALGGPFAYISSFQLSNAFPEKSGTVLALLTGAFDSSSAVFLFYKLFYNKFDGNFPVEKFFKIYLLVPVFMVIVQIFVMPGESYMTPPAATLPVLSQPTETTALLQESEDSLVPPPRPQGRRSSLGDAMKTVYAEDQEVTDGENSIFGVLHGFPASYQFRTYWFVLMCLFATIQMLRLNYFVATINSQYTYLLHSVEAAESLNKFFDIALPLGGVISIPFVGLFLDYCSSVVVLSALFAVSLVLGVLGVLPSFTAGVINVTFFVAYRPFFYTSISDYCAKVFGFETFGTVYGSIMTISGVFNFLQSFLDKETHTFFKMNPVPIDLVLVALTVVIGGATIWYVKVQAAIYSQKKKNVVVEDA